MEHTDTVRTSQETHYASAKLSNRLVLSGEGAAASCQNHKEHTDTLCGQSAEFLYVKAGGI
jgi:hypothetical protein